MAPVNRVRVIEEGDSSFVSGELVWKEDLEQGIEAIREENAKSLDESYEFVSAYKIIDVPSVTGKSQEPAAEGITRGALSSILQPGGAAGEIIAADEREEIKIIIGDASFRRAIEGFELIEDFCDKTTGEVILEAGSALTPADLTKVVSMPPQPLYVRDTNVLDDSRDSAWFAADVTVDGETIIKTDSALTSETSALLSSNNVKNIKLWKSP